MEDVYLCDVCGARAGGAWFGHAWVCDICRAFEAWRLSQEARGVRPEHKAMRHRRD